MASGSTGDILAYYVTHIWNKTLEAGNETLAVALNITKAFDMVWHKNLFAKLISVDLAPKLCKLFENFLSGRSIKVVIDGISSSFHANAGVPQGSVISPTLFLIYINDLLNLPSNPVHCYADDSTLHNALHRIKIVQTLPPQLIYTYADLKTGDPKT